MKIRLSTKLIWINFVLLVMLFNLVATLAEVASA